MALQLKPKYLNGGVNMSEMDFMQTRLSTVQPR